MVRDGDNAPSTRSMIIFAVVAVTFLIASYVSLVVVGDGNDDLCIEASSGTPTTVEVPC